VSIHKRHFRPPAAFSLVFNPRNSELCLSEIP
jgi:hypothetical protein